MLTVAIVGIVILFVTVLVIQCVTVVNDARDARRELDEQIRVLALVASSVGQTGGRRARNIQARARPMGRISRATRMTPCRARPDGAPRNRRCKTAALPPQALHQRQGYDQYAGRLHAPCECNARP